METRGQEVPEARQVSRNEVLPHLYGTYQINNARAAEGGHGKADADRWADTPEPQSRRLGHLRVDSEQLSDGPGIDPAGGKAAAVLGNSGVASADRRGDCPGPGVGQQEE